MEDGAGTFTSGTPGIVFSYLLMTSGARAGAHFILRAGDPTRIGRGLDCDVVLSDPLSSRVHATVVYQDDGWFVRDAGSRNGTFVNGQKIDEAQLGEGNVLKVGSTEFVFRQSPTRPTDTSRIDMTQTIVRDRLMEKHDVGPPAPTLTEAAKIHDLYLLHQLSIRLLGCTDPDEVIYVSLDLLRSRTHASVVGFLWVSDEGQLKPKLVIPEDRADSVRLSDSLTDMVIRQAKAIWVDDQKPAGQTAALAHFADALCAPLMHDGKGIGAIHLYLERGRFNQDDFDFAIPVANILTVALVRARSEALLKEDNRQLSDKAAAVGELLGDSKPMLDLKGKITRVARATGCVLIRGDSGVGKELVARALHELSLRKQKPFVTLDCGALPPTLIESALFGYERGAFTGADREYAGVFERAHGGTLFLDELGELPLDLQPKLLRAVERGEIERLRGEGAVRVDVRIIAATNRSREEMVAEKRFRSDLYYRLAVVHLALPALRERPGDLPLLVEHFLDRFGQARVRFEPDAMALLSRHSFPGNVRELANLVRRLSVLAAGDRISGPDLKSHLTPATEEVPAPPHAEDWSGLSFKDAKSRLVDHFEREYLEHVLKRHRFNVSSAAREAGIGRRHFHRLLEKYGISTRKEA